MERYTGATIVSPLAELASLSRLENCEALGAVATAIGGTYELSGRSRTGGGGGSGAGGEGLLRGDVAGGGGGGGVGLEGAFGGGELEGGGVVGAAVVVEGGG